MVSTDSALLQRLLAEVQSLRVEVGELRNQLLHGSEPDARAESPYNNVLDSLGTLDMEALVEDGNDMLYASGYLAGKLGLGEPAPAHGGTVDYMDGYLLGAAVRAGKSPPPYWDLAASN